MVVESSSCNLKKMGIFVKVSLILKIVKIWQNNNERFFKKGQDVYKFISIYASVFQKKKTRFVGGDRPHDITLRRRPSHASLENLRTPALPYIVARYHEKGQILTML